MLAQVTECHDRREKDGQRERHWKKRGRCIEQQLTDHIQVQALANKIIEVFPQPLHKQDEQGNEERKDERSQVGFDNELMKLLHTWIAGVAQI